MCPRKLKSWRGEGGEMNKQEYKNYLTSPSWKKTRRKALERSGYRCQVCNAANTQLDVHHRTYDRLGHEFDSDLTVLCNDCHSKFHDKLAAPVVPYVEPKALASDDWIEPPDEWFMPDESEEERLKQAANHGAGRWVELAFYGALRRLGLTNAAALERVSHDLNGGGYKRDLGGE